MGSFQVSRIANNLLVLSSLCLSAIAAPTTQSNSAKQWTFDEVRNSPCSLQESHIELVVLSTALDSPFEEPDMVSMPSEVHLLYAGGKSESQLSPLDYLLIKSQVPLDYSDPKGSQAAVPLIRIAAQDNSPNGTYQGMMLVNPGMCSFFPFYCSTSYLTPFKVDLATQA